MESPLLFLGPIALATLMPGPSMLLAMDHGLRFGARRSLAAALGNVTATLVQAALILACLSCAGQGPGRILDGIRFVGTLYLCYLGIGMLRTTKAGSSRSGSIGGRSQTVPAAYPRFRQGFFLTLWNPSAYLFFLAIFPPFLGSPAGTRRLLLGLVLPTLAITFACMMLYARFGQGLMDYLQNPRRERAFRVLMGTSFLALGIWMGLGG